MRAGTAANVTRNTRIRTMLEDSEVDEGKKVLVNLSENLADGRCAGDCSISNEGLLKKI